MEKRTKNVLIGVVVIGVIILALFVGKPYKSGIRTVQAPPKTAEQLEREDLVAKINSGSLLWQKYSMEEADHLMKAQLAAEAREKQERISAGYRKVLCEKFDFVLSANGGLEAAATCGDAPAAVSDFQ